MSYAIISIPPSAIQNGKVNTKVVTDPFGGNQGVVFSEYGRMYELYNSVLQLVGWSVEEGSVTSRALGLTLEYVNSSPITVKVENKKTTLAEIQVSDPGQ